MQSRYLGALQGTCRKALPGQVNFTLSCKTCISGLPKKRSSNLTLSEPAEHERDHGDLDETFGRRRVDFVVLAQATGIAEPGQGSLDQPAPRQHFELMGIAAADNGHRPLEHLLAPIALLQTTRARQPDDRRIHASEVL